MKTLRALLLIACVALAACAAPASQQPQTRRTGGNLPPEKLDNTCTVDADCAAKPQCKDAECRCVRNTCIAKRDALNPSIDPAPASSVR